MFVDYVLNGQGHGPVAEQLVGTHYDPGLLRPYIDSRGRKVVMVHTGQFTHNAETGRSEPVYKKRLVSELVANGMYSPVFNATSLRKQEWVQLDTVVLKAARARLRAWADLAGSNTYGGFNGMSRTVLEHEAMSDPGEAVVDMDGLTDGRSDRPRFDLQGLPLPITHSDFWFSSRQLAVSRNTGTPLDSTMAEAAGRRVAEMIEKTTIGTITGMRGTLTNSLLSSTPQVYGYTNFPGRIVKNDLTVPNGTNAASTIADVLEMRDMLSNVNRFGPFMLYHSRDWDAYLDNDYILTGGNVATQTLRERLRAIEGIQDVRRLDFLTDTFTLLMVQMTSDVARAVVGMDLTTVQWESSGGMRLNFKVMAIHVPQMRSDFNGSTGILHATTA